MHAICYHPQKIYQNRELFQLLKQSIHSGILCQKPSPALLVLLLDPMTRTGGHVGVAMLSMFFLIATGLPVSNKYQNMQHD